MNMNSFKVQFASMISEFGNEHFHSKSAEELWKVFEPLDEKQAVSIFEWAKANFKKASSPTVQDLIRKYKALEFAEQRRLENLNTGHDHLKSNEAYETLLKKLGTTSLAEAIVSGKHKNLK